MSNDAHSRPAGEAEELLYDPNVATPTHGERARTLVAAIRTGTLCTIAKEPAGFPYGSFVTFAMDDSNLVFFISQLAEHTKNLRADARASLLAAESGQDDPLAAPLYGDFDGIPPLLIQVGDDETLLDDSTRLAEAAGSAGVEVRLDVFPEMQHVFQLFTGNMPEADEAVAQIGAWLRPRLGL